ncbi:MAG TPA: DciA family protein [Lentisphaeria bacterium]|nr:DciA family protein [Lentisphaeria bacterium]
MSSKKSSNQWLSRSEYRQTFLHGYPSRREASREQALADWVGEDRRPGVFADLRPEAKNAADLVQDVLNSFKNPDLVLLEKIQDAWTELVGADNARYSQPTRIYKGRLYVEVPDSSWLFMFKTQRQADISARVASFTQNAITGVQFIPPGINPASSTHHPRKGQP